MIKLILFLLYFSILPSVAFSYIGPGMSGGVFAALLGIIVAILMAIVGIVWFPLKRLFLKKIQTKKS